MAAAVREDTRVVWIANPNNPTGTFVPAPEVEAFLQRVPRRVMVVLDQAYNEYLPDAVQADTVHWLRALSEPGHHAHVFQSLRPGRAAGRLRTGASRRGGPDEPGAPALQRQHRRHRRQPLAALDDRDFVRRSAELNRRGMRQITDGLKQLGRAYIPSFGNFVCFHAGAAGQVYQRLLEQGVIVRPIGVYGLPEHLRVTDRTGGRERCVSSPRCERRCTLDTGSRSHRRD